MAMEKIEQERIIKMNNITPLNTYEKHQYILNQGWFFQITKIDLKDIDNEPQVDKYYCSIRKGKTAKNFTGFSLSETINNAYKFVSKEYEYMTLCSKCSCELNEIKKRAGFGE